MRVEVSRGAPAFENCDPLGGRVTLRARRPDFVRLVRLPHVFFGVADQAPPPYVSLVLRVGFYA